MTRRSSLALILTGALSSGLAQALPEPGSVAVYSDGTVQRLLEKTGNGALWEDHRMRVSMRSRNPVLPPLWRKGPDGRVQYRHRLLRGRPDRLLDARPGDKETFVLEKTDAGGYRTQPNFDCQYLGMRSWSLNGRPEPVRHFRCERYKVHRKLWTRLPKETIDSWWSPRLGLVVESVSRRADGRVRKRRLLGLLSPGEYRYRKVVELLRPAGASEGVAR